MPHSLPDPADYFLRSPSTRRFHAVAAILERFVARAPRTCHLAQLMEDTDLAGEETRRICSALCGLGLISRKAKQWVLARHPGDITLRDVWDATLMVDRSYDKAPKAVQEHIADKEVNLLIEQAALAISQSIGAQLGKFQLDRVSTSKWGLLHVC